MRNPTTNTQKHLISLALVGLSALLASTACGPRDTIWSRPFETLGPVSVDGHLVSLSRASGQVQVLDPAAGRIESYVVAPRARTLTAIPGGVLVIGGAGNTPSIDRVRVATGETLRASLPAPYDRVWVAPGATATGGRALLSFDPNAPQAPGSLPARNNNAVAILDLNTLESTPLLLHTQSLSPREVIYSDDGGLAAVLLDSSVALIDLEASPVTQLTLPLRLDDGSVLRPEEGLFAPDASHLYLRVRGSNDLLSLELGRGAKLSATVNFLFLPEAQGLLDIARISGYESSVAALFRMPTGSAVAMLEGAGDTSKTKFAALSGRPTQLLDLGGGHLLACAAAATSTGSVSRYLAAWSIETGRVDEDALPGTYRGAPRQAGDRVFFAHGAVNIEGQAAAGAISVLRVDEDALRLRIHYSPVLLQGTGLLPSAALADGRLVLAVNIPRLDSGAPPADISSNRERGQVAYAFILGPEGETQAGVVLDDAAQSIETDEQWLYVEHATGDVTVLPLNDLQRSAARRYQAFAYNGLMAAEELSK